MDALFEVLRSSTDNEARKAATAQLRHLQSEQPDAFLQHTYDGVASAELRPELRFFLTTLVLSFVEESWRAHVSPAQQEHFIARYTHLVTSQSLPSVLLTRKVATVVATMARMGSRKAQVGALPPLVHYVVVHYVAELERATQAVAYDRLSCLLLALHLFLKEMQTTRVGHVFEDVCRVVAGPLSGVFALLPDTAAMLTHADVCLYLLKCSLRTFGRGAFDPAFCHFLLGAAWRLAEGLGAAEGEGEAGSEQRQRLLEYALKILEATVVYFPARLSELGVTFFTAETEAAAPAATAPRPLFGLLAAVVCSPMGTVVTEKAVCRALRLFTALLSAEDGDAFTAHCLATFAASPAFAPFLQHVVAAYLADTTTAEALAEWSRQPERVAAELDIDMDDETSPMGCAEQLFLAFTGSTGCAAPALAAAWAVVNQLLQSSDGSGPITAALHAIGVGYYTMTSEDNSAYLGFLRERLLPLLQPAALAQVSPFVARRVVWLVGMWCESVTDTHDRRSVLAALEAVLQHAAQTHNVVLVLVSLKATENFVSDNTFALSDMTATLVSTVLLTVEMLLKAVQSVGTIKELAGLVHVLTEKGAVQGHGEVLVQLFTGPTLALLHTFTAAKPVTDDGDGDEDDDAGDAVGSLGMLLDCLGSGVRQCGDDAVRWALLPSIVLPCITPTCAATPWAEDHAWELFLTLAQSSHAFQDAAQAQALPIALQHTCRDFAVLPIVFRVVYSLLVLRQAVVDDVVATADVEAWAAMLRDSPSAELCGAVTAVLTTVARMSTGVLRGALARLAVAALVASADVQADAHTLPLAVALAVCLAAEDTAEGRRRLVCAALEETRVPLSLLLEQLVLLLDVAPSALVSGAVARLLETLRTTASSGLSAEDAAMVQRAVEGVAVVAAAAGEEDGESRSPAEMLLEWFGDADVALTSPHVSRVMSTFALLLC